MSSADQLRQRDRKQIFCGTIVPVGAQEHLVIVRELFQQYARGLKVDLCFQGFEQELAELPGRYAPPSGRLFLASQNGQTAGCVAVRLLADNVCEMKRLYVRPAFRRVGLGRLLAQAAITAAREIGYDRMRLDTLGSMKEAIGLYDSLGFVRIEPYYNNPSACAVFMELALSRLP